MINEQGNATRRTVYFFSLANVSISLATSNISDSSSSEQTTQVVLMDNNVLCFYFGTLQIIATLKLKDLKKVIVSIIMLLWGTVLIIFCCYVIISSAFSIMCPVYLQSKNLETIKNYVHKNRAGFD